MSQASAAHPEIRAARARSAFAELRTPAEVTARLSQIGALPLVTWKGRTLHTLRCQGTSGKGPHDTNVPEGLLWSLIDLLAFRCPFHANDLWAAQARETTTTKDDLTRSGETENAPAHIHAPTDVARAKELP